MKNIPIEQVMCATGLTRRQVIRLTRKGCIPATIIGQNRFVMTSGQFDRLIEEGVKPEPKKKKNEPESPSFIRTMRKAS